MFLKTWFSCELFMYISRLHINLYTIVCIISQWNFDGLIWQHLVWSRYESIANEKNSGTTNILWMLSAPTQKGDYFLSFLRYIPAYYIMCCLFIYWENARTWQYWTLNIWVKHTKVFLYAQELRICLRIKFEKLYIDDVSGHCEGTPCLQC